MASLPSGSVAINAQFFRAPDGSIWQYFNSTLQFNKLYTADQVDEITQLLASTEYVNEEIGNTVDYVNQGDQTLDAKIDTEITNTIDYVNQSDEINANDIANEITRATTREDELNGLIDAVAGGVLNIIPTSSPTVNVFTYNASEAGTYTNFGGVVVLSGDLVGKVVQIKLINGVWTKYVTAIADLINYLAKSEIEYTKNMLFDTGSPVMDTRRIDTTGVLLFATDINWVCTTPILIDPTKELKIQKLNGSPQYVYFYTAGEFTVPNYISRVSIGNGEGGTITPPSNAHYIGYNIASIESDKAPNIAALKIWQDGDVIVKILNHEIKAKDTGEFLRIDQINIDTDLNPGFVLNDRLIISGGTTGTTEPNIDYVRTKPFFFTIGKPVTIKRTSDGGPSVVFYNTDGSVNSVVSHGAGTVTFTPPVGSTHLMVNVSTTIASRVDRMDYFAIFQPNAEKAIVSEINENKIIASDVENIERFVLKSDLKLTDSDNLFQSGNIEEDMYIGNAGLKGVGITGKPITDFCMATICRNGNDGTKMSFRRTSTNNILCVFFDEYGKRIASVPISTASSGTFDVPTGWYFMYVNVSDLRSNRENQLNNFFLVYGEEIPSPSIGQKTITHIEGYKVSGSGSEGGHQWVGKTIDWTGSSSAVYSREANGVTDLTGSYIERFVRKAGLIILNKYAISGRTVGVNTSAPAYPDPDSRNPLSITYTQMSGLADICIVHAGGNDMARNWVELGTMTDRVNTTFYGALHITCLGLKKLYFGKIIIFTTPFKRYFPPQFLTPDDLNSMSTPWGAKECADAIKEVCEYYGIPVIDLFTFCKAFPFEEDYRTLWQPDGTHLNAVGAEMAATELYNRTKII